MPATRLGKIDALATFGICDNWEFEEALLKIQPGLPIHAYDHSVSRNLFRQQVLKEIERIGYLKPNLAKLRARLKIYNGYKKFFSGNVTHFEERVFNRIAAPNDATLEKVFARLPGKKNVLLKMDIEGGEYRVIPDILGYAGRIDVLLVEFHETDALRETFVNRVQALLTRFEIVHIHANNYGGVADDGLPECLEITFLNKKFAKPGSRRAQLPLDGIDYPNDPARPDLPLIFPVEAKPRSRPLVNA